jgi:methyl-accepting chemotaxis protein
MAISLKISQKIWLSLAIIIIGYAISTFMGLAMGNNTRSQLEKVADNIFPATVESQAALSSFEKQVGFYNDAFLMGEESAIDSAISEAEKVRSSLEMIVSLNGLEKEILDEAAGLIDIFDGYSAAANEIYRGLSNGMDVDSTVLSELNDQQVAIDDNIRKFTNDFGADLKNNLGAVITQTRKQNRNNLIIFIGIILIAVVVVFYTVRSVSRPLNNVVEMLEVISQGDLTQQLEVKRKDEIGQLATAMNNMVSLTAEAIGGIKKGATQVAAASEEMNSSSESLSSGATQQAANLEETSASIEELTGSIEKNAQNSQEASKVTNESGNLMEEGSRSVIQTVDAMKKIAEKIGIINDISDQTNLLALNAAIEAARAGEMGKGFAVVAVEVRKLAERSQQAAMEISDLARNSVDLAEKAGDAIGTLAPMSEKTIQMVDEITIVCNEQSAGAEQIMKAIEQLNEVTQQNSSTAEEYSAASEAMAEQAREMQKLISRFVIDTEGQDYSEEAFGSVSGIREKQLDI